MSDWELCKENILPLTKGRQISCLRAALAPKAEDLIRQKQQEFETELRLYSGDDELQIWHKYIDWAEQSYPVGGKKGNIQTLIVNCIQRFKDKREYYNDERYVKIWLKYVNQNSNCIENFTDMKNIGIGQLSAMFYHDFAYHLDQQGNTKKAYSVIIEGLEKQAEPRINLLNMQKILQNRVTKIIRENSNTEEESSFLPTETNEEGTREAFNKLKPIGRLHRAPINRIQDQRALIPNNPQANGFQNQKSIKQIPIQIWNDENTEVRKDFQAQPSLANAHFVPQNIKQKENDLKAGKWSRNKMPITGQMTVPVGFEFKQRANFFVHGDDEENEPQQTPRKVPSSFGVLGPHAKFATPAVMLPEVRDSSKVSMYNTAHVYGGAKEMQFEEIRAAAWFKNREKIEKDLELNVVCEKLEKYRQENEHLKALLSISSNESSRHSSVQSSLIHSPYQVQMKRSVDDSEFTNSVKNKCGISPTREVLNLWNGTICTGNISETGRSDIEKQSEKSQYEIFQDQASFSNLPPLQFCEDPITKTSEGFHIMKDNQPKQAPFEIFSDPTETGFFPYDQENEKPQSFIKVTEKTNAPNVLFEIFEDQENENPTNYNKISTKTNAPNVPNVPFEIFEDLENKHPPNFDKVTAKTNAPNVPFGIFEDLENENPQCFIKPNENQKMPFHIFEDDYENDDLKENRSPIEEAVPEKRVLSGILQPSATIPFRPLEDDENESEDQDESRDSEDDGDLGVKPLDETDNNNFTLYTDNRSVMQQKKITSTPFPWFSAPKNNLFQEVEGHTIAVEISQPIKPKVLNLKDVTSRVSSGKFLSPIIEGSREQSKSSAYSASSSNFQTGISNLTGKTISHIQSLSIKNEDTESINTSPDLNKINVVKLEEIFNHEPLKTPVKAATPEKNCFQKHIRIEEDFDVFSTIAINEALKQIGFNLNPKSGFQEMVNQKLPRVKINDTLVLKTGSGTKSYNVKTLVGKGGCGNVYQVLDTNSKSLALKVSEKKLEWELWVTQEIPKRLKNYPSNIDLSDNYLSFTEGYFFENGSILVNDFCSSGTLLDVANVFKSRRQSMSQSLIFYLTWEMIQIILALHKCQFIHADIKPDNFLFLQLPKQNIEKYFMKKLICLRLIDFGQTIDLQSYEKGTTFNNQVKTSGFQCPEMLEKKPWTFQPDLFGLLGSIHVLIFGEYMTIRKSSFSYKWETQKKFKRYYAPFWNNFFDQLLNVENCDNIPNLEVFLIEIEQHLSANRMDVLKSLQNL